VILAALAVIGVTQVTISTRVISNVKRRFFIGFPLSFSIWCDNKYNYTKQAQIVNANKNNIFFRGKCCIMIGKKLIKGEMYTDIEKYYGVI
jgi:hypothetical protein